jgi:TonB family protein
MRTLSLALLLLFGPWFVPAAAGQTPLDEAKGQYAAAAYEDALTSLARATGAGANRVEVEQYRAFCLIALGRMEEAAKAVAALVQVDPKYAPSPTVASPRVLGLVTEMRKKELPAVARRLLDTGRAAFQEKDFARAQQDLTLLLQILDDPAMRGRPETSDLRVLAEGFATLAAAQGGPSRPGATPASPTSSSLSAQKPTSGTAPPVAASNGESSGSGPSDRGPANGGSSNGGSSNGGFSSPSAPLPQGTEVVQADNMTEPVPILQQPPPWIPPNPIAASKEYLGSVRVRIGVDGRVISATIEQPTYPSYDARLLQVARQWLYKPATRNGEPVESERVVPVQLRPRQ